MDRLTEEQIRWVQESTARAEKCRGQLADMAIFAVKLALGGLLPIAFGLLALWFSTGFRAWIMLWLTGP